MGLVIWGFDMRRSLILLLGMAMGFGGISACSNMGMLPLHATGLNQVGDKPIVTMEDNSLFGLVNEIASRRVVYIGETHDRYDHHLNQLAVIKRLHQQGVELAIGMEFFQRPSQQHLDDYISGEIDEKRLLKLSGYYRNWGYDFRLYRPILEFARRHDIALVALNAPSGLVGQVSEKGFGEVDDEWRAMLPEIQLPADAAYKDRLRRVFEMHSGADRDFDRFLQVQLLWDEYMAESAAAYLKRHPNRKLVVLAGSGHVAEGTGIPQRVQLRVPEPYTVLTSMDPGSDRISDADHLLLASGERLPAAGKLGLYIREVDEGVTVHRWARERSSGIQRVIPGDLISHIAGERIRSMEDVRLAMLDRLPGEQVWVELERGRDEGKRKKVTAVIELI